MQKGKISRLVFALVLVVLGFASTSSAVSNCVLVDNFCSGCAAGKVRSCDRYRCKDDLSGNYVYYNSCTACGNAC
jgi:hypothetical protein